MEQRFVGDTAVSAIGLGAMKMSLEGRPDEASSLRTIAAALDAGVRLIDTADAYCRNSAEMGHNERLVAKALAAHAGDADDVLVATKGWHTRDAAGGWHVDGRPEYIRSACEASLVALGVETIGLYQYHRPDPSVPYADTIGALRDLRDEGKIRHVGISNANLDQIRTARSIVPVEAVQNQFSPSYRSSEPELDYCAGHEIAFLPWSPFGGIGRADRLGGRHAAFSDVAGRHGVSPQQVCLAWMLAKAPVVIPIPGASRPETARDCAAATDLRLTAAELALLDAA